MRKLERDEHRAKSLVRAYPKNCLGCQDHDADIMMSIMSEEDKEKLIFVDIFMTELQAEYLIKELQDALAKNRYRSMPLDSSSTGG